MSSAAAAITRTGKLIDDPRASELYAKNPCPPARFLPKKSDFKDSAGNSYVDVAKNKKLQSWADQSPLLDMIAGELQENDTLFFVRQNKERKKEGDDFILQDEGEILLQSTEDDETSVGRIVAVGDHSSSGYTARSVVWMLIRDLRI